MTEKKRPGSIAGDDERVAAGEKYRRGEREGAVAAAIPGDQGYSKPIIVENHDHPTPVPFHIDGRRTKSRTVQEFAEDAWADIRELRETIAHQREAAADRDLESEGRITHLEARLSEVSALGESVDDLNRVDREIGELRVELIGAQGLNGKLGTLRADIARELDSLKRSIWGDEARKTTDVPVIHEARRGKWIIRMLAGLAIGVAGTGLVMIKNSAESSGRSAATIEAMKADIKILHQENQYLYGLVYGAKVRDSPVKP